MPGAFYEIDGDRYAATELTRGPWDPGAQHAGPPAALIGREIERLPDAADFHVGRITFEILRSVPIAPLMVSARIVRPGRRVQMVEATLSDEDGEVMKARAWRLRIAEVDLPQDVLLEAELLPGPEQGSEVDFFPVGGVAGYHTAMEVKFVEGGFLEPGPARAWLRMRHPLVVGEEPSPLQRVLIAADVGNGISASLDWRQFLFINVDLTVQLERMPDDEWVGVDAVSLLQAHGTGTAESTLLDRRGRIGRGLQTLLVSPRF